VEERFFDIEESEPVQKFDLEHGFKQEIYKQGDTERIIIRRPQNYDGGKQQDDGIEVVSPIDTNGETLETLLESICTDYDWDYRGIRIDPSAKDMKYENGIFILNERLLKEGGKAIADKIEQFFKEG
jgi:hypothetical protein